ncbi:Oxysterol-binding protein-domain-containing protein [Choanephora cucurbitarum]|nr:Oxysterol-binding protein-domain-containing protein [Choanephora cucurbitarum]
MCYCLVSDILCIVYLICLCLILKTDNMFSRTTPKLLFFTVTTDEPLYEDLSVDVDMSGWLLKKRRKRMQGWAKRWFELSSTGVLSYSVSKGAIKRGSLQVGLSTILISAKHRTIHLDSGTTTFHIKAPSAELLEQWLTCIHARRSACLSANQNPIIWDTDEAGFEPVAGLVPELILNMNDNQPQKQRNEENHLIISKSLSDIDMHLVQLKQLLFGDSSSILPNETLIHPNSAITLEEHKKQSVNVVSTSYSNDNQVHVSFVQALINAQLDETQTYPSNALSHQKALINAISTSLQSIKNCRDTISDAYHEMQQSKQEEYDGMSFNPLQVSNKTKSNLLSHRSVKSLYSHSILSDKYFDAEDYFMSSDENESIHDFVGADSEEEGEDENKGCTSLPPATDKHSVTPDDNCDTLVVQRRDRLPHPVAVKSVSFLGVLRKNVGKDLSTISMPIIFNEPINLLQHLCGELEYSDLIEKAAHQASPVDRLTYVALFAISGYASSQYRIDRKPFNPLLFETYECVRPDKGFRFISEKVSHHPNILACYADAKLYEYSQSCSGKTKFWGKSMELVSEGQCCIKLKEHNDVFTYSKPSSWLRNLVAGTKYIEHIGEMKVINHTTGDYAIVTFKEAAPAGTGFFANLAFDNSQYRNHVTVKLYNQSNSLVKELQGKWNESMSEVVGPDQYSTLWRCKPPSISNYDDYYGFTSFLMELNEITILEKSKIPVTDTRYRPDQRLFEEGKVSEAESEKERIEQLQRERRKQPELSCEQCQPLWFELKEDSLSPKGQTWQYKGGYWEARSKNQWPNEMVQLW